MEDKALRASSYNHARSLQDVGKLMRKRATVYAYHNTSPLVQFPVIFTFIIELNKLLFKHTSTYLFHQVVGCVTNTTIPPC